MTAIVSNGSVSILEHGTFEAQTFYMVV